MHLIVNINLPGRGIGRQGQLLTRISADMKRFAALTTGNIVICGRKTLETFPGGRPLKNRTSWILSSDPDFAPAGAVVFSSLEQLLDSCSREEPDRLWVIGGASIYAALLPWCREAHVTRTFRPAQADAFFPDLDSLPGWSLTRESEIMEEAGIRFQFADYTQASPRAFNSPR